MENKISLPKLTKIEEWEAEDMLFATLGDEETRFINEEEVEEMLDKVIFELPQDINVTELINFNEKRETPLTLEISPDNVNFNFYLIEVPLNILIPKGKRAIRLRLKLNLLPGEGQKPSRRIIAYDLFPPDQWDIKEFDFGEAKVDVSKALTFIQPLAGKIAGECFNLELNFPVKWKTTTVRVKTTDRNSNPVHWYVTDKNIQREFTAYAIIRSQKGIDVTVKADLVYELRTYLFKKIEKVITHIAHLEAPPRLYTLS